MGVLTGPRTSLRVWSSAARSGAADGQRWTHGAPLQHHVRTAAWVAALVALTGTAAAVLGGRPDPLRLAAAVLGIVCLTVHWGLGRCSPRRAHGAGDLLDALALVPVASVLLDSPQLLTLAYGGVFVRTLRPGPVAAALRVPAYLAGLCGGWVLAAPRVDATALLAVLTAGAKVVPGLLFMTAFTALLGTALARADRAARGDRLLAESGVRLMEASTVEDVLRQAEDVASRMVADLPPVGLRLVPPSEGVAVGRRRRSDELRSGGHGTVRALPFADGAGSGGLELRGRARVLDEAEPSLSVLTRQVGLALRTCAAEAELRRRAETDGLTGLATGEVLRGALDAAVRATATRPDRPAATLVLVDCDEFKLINDTWGHSAGDAVLQQIAHRLRQVTEAGDVVARLGGDEFAVLLAPAPQHVGGVRVAQVVGLLNGPVRLPTGREVGLSCSVGAIRVRHGCSGAQLLHEADTAMYAAKAAREQPGRSGPRAAPRWVSSVPDAHRMVASRAVDG